MSSNCNGGSFVGGVVLGALVGAAVALLYAPCTGEETRKILKKKALLAKKKALEMKEEVAEGLDDLKEKAGKEAKGLEKKAKKTVNDLRGRVGV